MSGQIVLVGITSVVPAFSFRYYENYQIGTFVLYKSSFWPLEVHVRQWECGSLEHAASCVCGVVVRDGGDAVALDMCNGVMGETQPQLTVRSRDSNRNGIRIAESYQGRKVTVSPDATERPEPRTPTCGSELSASRTI